MKRKIFLCTIVAVLGGIVGILLGGYLGLVIGGNLLGGLKIYESIGVEGYELSAYIGAVVGAVIISKYAVKFILKKFKAKDENIDLNKEGIKDIEEKNDADMKQKS